MPALQLIPYQIACQHCNRTTIIIAPSIANYYFCPECGKQTDDTKFLPIPNPQPYRDFP